MRDARPWVIAAILGLLVALPWIADAIGQPALTGMMTRALIYGIAAASLNLALGYGGMVSFGHAAFFGIGAYTVGILYAHHSSGEPFLGLIPGTDRLILTIPAAMVVSGLMAAVIGALSLRTTGVQFIMITLAFAQMLFFLFVSLEAYGGDDGLIIRRANEFIGLNLRDKATMYWLCLAFAAATLLILHRIVNSRFGMAIAGLRQSERRMQVIGLHPWRYRLAAFTLSGMGAGLAGALMANYLRFASPDMLHWTKSGELMIMVILGGVGTLIGPFLGAFAFIALESSLAARTEHWPLALGLILLLVVLWTRGGLRALLLRMGHRR